MNYCLNLIKISIKNNKKGFIIINNKKNLNLIKAFIKINIIKYIKIFNNKIIVFLNYINSKPLYKNIIGIFKNSNKKYINLKTLKFLNSNNNWILIVSTSKGLLNSFEAANLQVGGLIIAKIWN